MNKIICLSKRNIKLFFATKANLFFACLALMILVVLHFTMFRSQNADALLLVGSTIDEKWAYWFSDSIMLSALIPIAGTTISLSSLAQIVADKEKNIINDLYISPITKNTLLFSYLISSIIIGLFLISIYIVFLCGYFFVMYGVLFSFIQILAIIGLMILSVLLGNLFVLLIMSFVKREQAVGPIGTVLGTTIGFLCGAYLPIGLLGESITNGLTFLPFLPITSLSRQIFFMNISSTGIPKETIGGELASMYGYELSISNFEISNLVLLVIVLVYIGLLAGVNVMRFKKMKNNN